MESVPQNRDSKLKALYSALLGREGHGLSNQNSGHRTVCVILGGSLVISTLWLVTSPGWLNWIWRCLGIAESNGYSGNSTGLLVDILEFWSWANACHSSAFPSFQTNKGGHEMDIRMVFCVNSRETWRLAQCFALEGLTTSSWRYGPMELLCHDKRNFSDAALIWHSCISLMNWTPSSFASPRDLCPTDGVSVTHTMRVNGMLSGYRVLASQSLLSCY